MNSPRSAGLIIILDTGPQMAPHWPVIRNGIAQMMLVLTKDTLIGGKYKLQALLFQLSMCVIRCFSKKKFLELSVAFIYGIKSILTKMFGDFLFVSV